MVTCSILVQLRILAIGNHSRVVRVSARGADRKFERRNVGLEQDRTALRVAEEAWAHQVSDVA
jgi:hypothetical protein